MKKCLLKITRLVWPDFEGNKIVISVMPVILCKLLKVSPAMPAAPISSSCAQTCWDTEPTPSLAAEHSHWQQWCREAAPTRFPLLTWSVLVHMWERGGRIWMHNSFSACPAWRRPSHGDGEPDIRLARLVGFQGKSSGVCCNQAQLSFPLSVCPHSSALWRGCQSASPAHPNGSVFPQIAAAGESQTDPTLPLCSTRVFSWQQICPTYLSNCKSGWCAITRNPCFSFKYTKGTEQCSLPSFPCSAALMIMEAGK